MKVEFSTFSSNNILVKNKKRNDSIGNNTTINETPTEFKLAGSQVPFGAIYGVKTAKMDILMEKLKMMKKVEDMINEKNSYSQDTVIARVIRERESKLRGMIKRKLRTIDIEENFTYDDLLWETQDEIIAFMLRVSEEANAIIEKYNATDTKDYKLLSKIHSAIINDNLNLGEVCKDYYAKLNELSTIKEVKKHFPKLELPVNPTTVISRKIVRLLTKDFYTTYDELRSAGKTKEANAFCQETIKKLLRELTDDSVDRELLERKLLKPTTKAAIANYNKTKNTTGFATVPEIRKIKPNMKLTPADIRMAAVDYNQFALYVLRQQYVEAKTIDEIVYREGANIIPIKSLKGTDYKIAKPDNRITTFIKQAEAIRAAERNYERFSDEQLLKRLEHFSDMESASDPVILDRMIEFSNSQIAEGDRTPLIKLLRIMDDITDKKISIEEGAKLIEDENLHPHGTIQLDKAAKEKRIKEIKTAQKITAEFNNYCQRYDDAIDMLFKSNMIDVATQCTMYRPKDINESREMSSKIMHLISSGIKDKEFVNPSNTEYQLKNLNKYFQTKLYEEHSPTLKAAEEFSLKADGTVDEVKAGEYISGSETISQYPASKSLYGENEAAIIDEICKNSKTDPETAIRNIIKYNNYRHLPPKEQLKISTLLKTFDINVPAEKGIIEEFVNNIYINSPTHIETTLNKAGTSTKESVMMPSAKVAIIEDKLFPLCLYYFEIFEKYMTRVAQAKDEFGIQVIGTNNKQLRKQFKFEVKVPMEERLYSREGDFKFEVYQSGLHKAKNTKA